MTETIKVAAPPTTADVAFAIMSWMNAQSGILTDFNSGSQIRVLAESIGSVQEMQSVIVQAIAFQAMVYGAFAAFDITPNEATYAVRTVKFITSLSEPAPLATQDVPIPSGTIVQTIGGIQFATDTSTILVSGTSEIETTATALVAGSTGNVGVNTIRQLASGLSYPLQVINENTTDDQPGMDAETPDQTLGRFTAKIASLGLSTPIAIANAVIGVSSGTERVLFSTVYEPWIAEETLEAGFYVYIDNGSGAASSDLIDAVKDVLDGSFTLNQMGYRPAGVPYDVYEVTPVSGSVTVSGTLVSSTYQTQVETAITTAITSYNQSLNFGDTAYLTELTARIGSTVSGYLSALSITLTYNGGSVTSIAASGVGERVYFSSITITLT